jgi:chromosome segregation ATPase
VITVLNKAVSISNEEHKRAMALTDDLANKLRTTERRIKELEEEVSHFRDRAARAEEWMQRISREIESKFIAPEGVLSKTALGAPDQDR